MNPHAVPYLRFIFPFVLGLAIGGWLDAPLPYLDWGLMVGAIVGALIAVRKIAYRYRWVFGLYVHGLLFVFGYYHIVQHNELRQADHFSVQETTGRYYIGMVSTAPSTGAKVKLQVQVEALGSSPDSFQAASGNVILFLDSTPFADSIRYGDRIGFQATLRPTEGPKNPNAFDYGRYLHFKNIHHQAFVKPDSIVRLSAGHGSWLWAKAYESRTRLLTLLQHYFPSLDEYAVASALLVGYTDDLSDDMRTAYAETGSMHALAVSGTHIGMLYVGLMFLIGRLKLRGRGGKLSEMALIMAGIWAFTFLTGATASVLRASVMFSIYMVGKTFWRRASAWNVLPASAFFLMLFNPYMLFDVGFQLSYAAVAGMVFFYPRFYKMFPRLPRWIDEPLQVLVVGMAAQLGTLPLTLFYFNQFPVYFWLAGWVVVFVGAVFLWGGASLVILDALSKTLAEWLGIALYQMLFWMNKIIFFIQGIPGGVLRNVWVAAWAVAVMYACLVCLGAAMMTRRGKWITCFVALMALLGGYRTYSVTAKQQQETVVLYHVNKARLIDFFDGDHTFSLSDTLTAKQESFAAQANRTACGMRDHTQILISDSTAFVGNNLLVDWPFIQFFQQKMAVLDHPRWLRGNIDPPIKLDVLVLSKSTKTTIAQCRERFSFRVVVFDASNSYRQCERWSKECTENGWAYHDVRTMGAWVWKSND